MLTKGFFFWRFSENTKKIMAAETDKTDTTSFKNLLRFNSISEYLEYLVFGYINSNKFNPKLNIPNDIKSLIILFYGSYIYSLNSNAKSNSLNINHISLSTKASKKQSITLTKVISTFPISMLLN